MWGRTASEAWSSSTRRLDENLDIVPPGVTGWVVKPVEIDDVPAGDAYAGQRECSSDDMTLRRVAEELTQRLAGVKDVSRAYVVGGRPRVVQVLMDPDRMAAHHVSPLELQRAIQAANVRQTAGDFRNMDRLIRVEAGEPFSSARQLRDLVVGVFDGRPVFLKDVARVEDGPEEMNNYVRHGWGPARGSPNMSFFPAPFWAKLPVAGPKPASSRSSQPAVTIAIAKKKGANAVWVANAVLGEAEKLRETIIPQQHGTGCHAELWPDRQ